MTDAALVPIVARLAAAFVAAFPAIALWSRSRDPAWMLVVLGALLLFLDALYAVLETLGLVSYDLLSVAGVNLLQPILASVPYLFLAAGFLVFLSRNRRY